MRVALDATVVRPPLSGVHYAVRNGVRALCNQFPKQDSICFTLDPDILATHSRLANTTTPALSTHLRTVACRVLWQQTMLRRRLITHRADALIALAYTAPHNCPVPYAVHIHDTIALRKPGLCSGLNALHMRTLMPNTIRQADYIFTSAKSEAEAIVQLTGISPKKVHRIPLGVDPIFVQTSPPLAADYRDVAPYILFVGTIEPKKGLELLLSAYRQVAADINCTLVVAGRVGWKTRSLVRRMDRYDGPGRVVRLGYVPRHHLPGLYANAQAYIMPSLEEGFGLPVLEAMACKTPVLHSNHPALVETAGGCGATFVLGDSHDLARQLVRIIGSDDYQTQLSDNGHRWANTQTWTNWARQVAAITGYFT